MAHSEITTDVPFETQIIQQVSEIFKLLSDPTRLRIITLLLQKESPVNEIAKALDVSQSAVSHQLRMLRQVGLVRFRKEGRHVYYAIDDEHVSTLLEQAIEHVQHS